MSDKLTLKQLAFVKHYLVTANQAEAARRTGISVRTAARYLHEPQYAHVANEVRRRQEARGDQLGLDANFVLQELHRLYQRVVQDVRPALNSKTGKPLVDPDTGAALYTFNSGAALKALELIGKHMGVGAFKDVVHVNADDDLIARLQAGRNRIAQNRKNEHE